MFRRHVTTVRPIVAIIGREPGALDERDEASRERHQIGRLMS